MPFLGFNGAQDGHFSVDTPSRSHEAVKHSWLTIHPAMAHSHPPGWDPKSVPEIYAFADYVLKNGAALPTITRQPSGTSIVVKYASPRPITNATVWFLTEPLSYNAPAFTTCA